MDSRNGFSGYFTQGGKVGRLGKYVIFVPSIANDEMGVEEGVGSAGGEVPILDDMAIGLHDVEVTGRNGVWQPACAMSGAETTPALTGF